MHGSQSHDNGVLLLIKISEVRDGDYQEVSRQRQIEDIAQEARPHAHGAHFQDNECACQRHWSDYFEYGSSTCQRPGVCP